MKKFNSIHIDLRDGIYKINEKTISNEKISLLVLIFEHGRYELKITRTDTRGNEFCNKINNFQNC